MRNLAKIINHTSMLNVVWSFLQMEDADESPVSIREKRLLAAEQRNQGGEANTALPVGYCIRTVHGKHHEFGCSEDVHLSDAFSQIRIRNRSKVALNGLYWILLVGLRPRRGRIRFKGKPRVFSSYHLNLEADNMEGNYVATINS